MKLDGVLQRCNLHPRLHDVFGKSAHGRVQHGFLRGTDALKSGGECVGHAVDKGRSVIRKLW